MSALDEPEGVDGLAAEFVIGTLDATERAAFTSRLGTDERARRAVAAWERRLSPLQTVGIAVSPPPEVWSRIENALTVRNRLRVVDGGVTDAGLRRSRDRWRLLALSTAGIAAVLVGFVLVREIGFGRADRVTTYVAAVNRGGDKPALIVTVDLETRQVLVRPVAAQIPAGRSLQLWYIGGGHPPQSMGLVTDVAARGSLPGGDAADGAATFAVSIEPPGGSTTGGPTGAVVYSGQLVKP